MVVKVGDMIDREKINGACNKLDTIYNKCDGNSAPKDFITGEAAPALADMFNALMINLECD
jgi:hypothetical protein